MLKVIHNNPVAFGEKILLCSLSEIYENIMRARNVYCIKNCFHSEEINLLRKETFNYFTSIAPTQGNIQSFGYANPELPEQCQHAVVHGISPYQKSLHYYHVYAFSKMDNLPPHLGPRIKKLYSSLLCLYNDLTGQNYGLDDVVEGTKRFRPHLVQYPSGGGMFAAHTHSLEPQKIGIILGFSKRGEDFESCATGFEAQDGSIIDTLAVHDLSDILLFRYDVKHWVSPCDIEKPLDDTRDSGRWTALFAIS